MLNVIAGSLSEGTPPVTNSYESIATFTLSGSASDITFSSIPQTYTHLQVRGIMRNSTTAGGDINLRVQLNGVTTANYPWHFFEGNGSSASAAGVTTETNLFMGRLTNSASGANVFGTSVIDILDYTSTNKNKTLRALTGVDDNGTGYVGLYSGLTTSSIAAVTSIKLFPQGGSFAQYSSFALYGIKG